MPTLYLTESMISQRRAFITAVKFSNVIFNFAKMKLNYFHLYTETIIPFTQPATVAYCFIFGPELRYSCTHLQILIAVSEDCFRSNFNCSNCSLEIQGVIFIGNPKNKSNNSVKSST